MARIASSSKGQSVANSLTPIFECPQATKFSSVTIQVVNMADTLTKLTIYVSSVDVPPASDMVECELIFSKKGTKFKSSFDILVPGEKIIILADSSNLAIRVSAISETE